MIITLVPWWFWIVFEVVIVKSQHFTVWDRDRLRSRSSFLSPTLVIELMSSIETKSVVHSKHFATRSNFQRLCHSVVEATQQQQHTSDTNMEREREGERERERERLQRDWEGIWYNWWSSFLKKTSISKTIFQIVENCLWILHFNNVFPKNCLWNAISRSFYRKQSLKYN